MPAEVLQNFVLDALTIVPLSPTLLTTTSCALTSLFLLQAATLARGRSVRQSKLLFYGKLAEKALQTYERDGWGEFPTQIVVERREIRPTADRGPILLCVDTSGNNVWSVWQLGHVRSEPVHMLQVCKTCMVTQSREKLSVHFTLHDAYVNVCTLHVYNADVEPVSETAEIVLAGFANNLLRQADCRQLTGVSLVFSSLL